MTNPDQGVDPILSIENVSKTFGGVRAVSGLDLAVYQGELRCLIGPNGAGKSTVFKLIMGAEQPTRGKIRFENTDITRMKPWQRARRGLSIKQQIPNVYADLTVYDNMRVAAQNHIPSGETSEEIHRLLTLVDLVQDANKEAKNLSHGQQQWLEIGMALSVKPELLLLDEPTAGMGPTETASTAELIRSLNQTGMTVIVIDHDMSFVRSIAQRVSVLHLGELFAEGSIEEIESDEDVIRIYLGKA